MTRDKSFRFHAAELAEWTGRYQRIEGLAPVFHVQSDGKVMVFIDTDEGRVGCQALPCMEVKRMSEAINNVKWRYNGQAGGSFLINEFGQVLVPTMGKGRFYVGRITGRLQFVNLDTESIFDLSDDSQLQVGDPWELPYVGMQYNLSTRHRIYYRGEEPPVQDKDLVKKIRSIRRSGPVRFLVNPYGLVLTKAPVGEFVLENEIWKPVYIGRIDYNKWFAEEDAQCQMDSSGL